MTESRIVTAVGTSVNSERLGESAAKYIEDAMADEIRQAISEGITTEEKDVPAMKARMQVAHDRALAAMTR